MPRPGRGGRLEHVERQAHEALALDHAPAPRLAADEAQALERGHDPVRGGRRQVQGRGDLGDGEGMPARGDLLQHAQRLGDGARLVVGTARPAHAATVMSVPAKRMRARWMSRRSMSQPTSSCSGVVELRHSGVGSRSGARSFAS